VSTTESPILGRAVNWHRSTLSEWDALDDRTQTTAKALALVGVTVVAFHYSLISLLQTIGLDTPLAYVGLVPLIAAGLAWINRAPRVSEPAIHDRQLDYIVGLPLVGAATVASLVLPSRIGVMYWVNRIDLLFLPVFVVGATVLLFGVRIAWRQKVALGYLFLGWPWLYTTIFLGALGGFTSLTLAGLKRALDIVHVGTPVTGDPGLFQVVHNGHTFPIAVVSACSGVDGIVGFLLIGTALGAIVQGSLARKALWLALGLVLLWTTNLIRLLVVFWAGSAIGPHFALDVLHPVAGLVMFCIGVGIMAALLRPFGLSRIRPVGSVSTSGTKSGVARPRVFLAIGLLLVVALILSPSNASLRSFNPVAGATGQPKLGSFLADPAAPSGWTANFRTEYTNGKPLFGEDSRWFRYTYAPTSPDSTELHSTLPVTADIVDADNLSGFEAYGITACYSFHGFTLKDVASVDLGDGIVGQALSYSGAIPGENWSIVYWILPVETGSGTRYERVVLYLQNTGSNTVSLSPRTPDVSQMVLAARQSGPAQRLLLTNRAFLVAFARQMISGQAQQKDTDVLIDAVQDPGSFAVQLAAREDNGTSQAGAEPGTTSPSGVNVRFKEAYLYEHPLSASDLNRK
jgi:exosortase